MDKSGSISSLQISNLGIVKAYSFLVDRQLVKFTELEVGSIYDSYLNVVNTSKTPIRLKIVQPALNCFSLSFKARKDILAPGMQVIIKVTFNCCQDLQKESQAKIVSSSGDQRTIRLIATADLSNLVYQPFVNFGIVRVGKESSKMVSFSNQGLGQCNVELKLPQIEDDQKSPLSIYPSAFTIPARSKFTVKFTFCENTVRELIQQVHVASSSLLNPGVIQVKVNCVQYQRLLIHQGKQISQFSFGKTNITQAKEATFYLVNNSPAKTSFVISLRDGQSDSCISAVRSPEQVGLELEQRQLHVFPESGEIGRFSQLPIRLSWRSARLENGVKSYQKSFKLKVEFAGEQQFCQATVSGEFYLPIFSLSARQFSFQQTCIYQQKKETLQLTNEGQCPITFTFQKSHCAQVIPHKLVVYPDKPKSVSVSFKPKTGVYYDLLLRYYVVSRSFQGAIQVCGQGKVGQKQRLARLTFVNRSITKNSSFSLGSSQIDILNQTMQKATNKSSLYLPRETKSRLLPALSIQKRQKVRLYKQKLTKQKVQHPVDVLFELGLDSPQLKDMEMNLPQRNEVGQIAVQEQKHFHQSQLLTLASEFDTAKIKYYPAKARNKEEEATAKRQLSSKELQAIKVVEQCLDFGQVAINSTSKKVFHLFNGTNGHIAIKLLSPSEGYADSFVKKQFVPPYKMAGVEIQFRPGTLGDYSRSLAYSINDRHRFQIPVQGQSMPVVLLLSKTQFKFNFQSDCRQFKLSQTFTIRNPGNRDASLRFISMKESSFSVSPVTATVKSKESIECKVTYSPEYKSDLGHVQHEERIKIKIEDGNELAIKCVGSVYEGRLSLKQYQVRQDSLCQSQQLKIKLYLKNMCKTSTAYRLVFDQQIAACVSGADLEGVIRAEQAKEVVLVFVSKVIAVYDTTIVVKVRAGKDLKIPFFIRVVKPMVQLKGGPQLNFGTLAVLGSPGTLPLQLTNQSSIDFKFQLEQTKLLQSEGLAIHVDESNKKCLIKASDKRVQLRLQPGDVLIAKAKSSLNLYASYSPTRTGSISFKFPLVPLSRQLVLPDCQATVSCKGIETKFTVDRQKLEFRRILQSQMLNHRGQQVVIYNSSYQPVSWRFTNSSVQQLSPFQIKQTEGILPAGERQTIQIGFQPTEIGEYSRKLEMVLDGMSSASPYLVISLAGSAVLPLLIFDRRELVLSSVPLGQTGTGHFYIQNDGYQNIKLDYEIIDQVKAGVSLIFPQGRSIGLTKPRIRVEAIFSSKIPISFTVKAVFRDDKERSFVLPISGTADNSIFTIEPFFVGKETTLLLRDFPAQASQQGSRPTFMFRQNYSQKVCQQLKDYLNIKILQAQKISSFPQTLISDMDLTVEIITKLKPEIMAAVKDRKKAPKLQQFSLMLKSAKSMGALLNHIRPEWLLSFDQFIGHMQDTASPQYALHTELSQFIEKSVKAWSEFMFQLLKLNINWQVGHLTALKSHRNTTCFSKEQLLIIEWLWNNCQLQKQESLMPVHFYKLIDPQILYDCLTAVTDRLSVIGIRGKSVSQKLQSFLSHFQIKPSLKVDRFSSCTFRGFMLLLSSFYHDLGDIAKEENVLFQGAMGDQIEKVIQITNPRSEEAVYNIILFCNNNFHLKSEQTLVIPAKSTRPITVNYSGRHSSPEGGYLLLLDLRGWVKQSSILLHLTAKIDDSIAEKVFRVSSPLYQPFQFQIQLVNKFSADVDFQITIQPIAVLSDKPKRKASQLPRCFVVKNSRLKIKKGNKGNAQIIYQPFVFAQLKYKLRAIDPYSGAIIIDIIGQPQMPAATIGQQITIPPCLVGQPCQFLVPVPVHNQALINYKAAAQKLIAGSIIPSQATLPSFDLEDSIFDVQAYSHYSNVNLKSQKIYNSAKDRRLPLHLEFTKATKQAVVFVQLRGKNRTDYRKLKIKTSASNKPERLTLNLCAQIRNEVVQYLPITNNYSRDVTYKVALSQTPQGNSRAFSVPTVDLVVQSNKAIKLPITFRPKLTIDYSALLIMVNTYSQQSIELTLKGIGLQPTATDQYKIQVGCGNQVPIQIPIQNNSPAPMLYSVTIDHQAVFGPDSISVPPNSKAVYEAVARPAFIGMYSGSVTFSQQVNRYFWYSIEIDSTVTAPIDSFKVKAAIRDQVRMSIPINNAHNQPETFHVSLDNSLLGKSSFTVPANSHVQYELVFAPLTMLSVSSKIYFKSKLRECYYCFEGEVLQPQSEKIMFRTQIGTSQRRKIKLQNKSSKTSTAKALIQNHDLVQIEPGQQLVIPGRGSIEFTVIYSPSTIGRQTCELKLQSQELGEWRYLIIGEGVVPSEPIKVDITAELFSKSTSSIKFINPFQSPIRISAIKFEESDQFDAFEIAGSRRDKEVLPLQPVYIPLSFLPKRNQNHFCKILISINEVIKFNYEISGRVFWRAERPIKLVRGECGQTIFQVLQVELPAVPQHRSKHCRVALDDPDPIVQKAVSFKQQFNIFDRKLELYILFRKPIKNELKLKFSHQLGGSWEVHIQLDIRNNTITDTIRVQANIKQPAAVRFRLTNRTNKPASFSAYLTDSTDQVFIISPRSGNLPAAGADEGQPFTLTFSPNEYKRMFKGQLVVQTAEAQWVFRLEGTLPKYVPPKKSRRLPEVRK